MRAPFSGTLLQLLRPDQSSVRRGDTIALIEQQTNRHILAFLSQDEVANVGLGDTAQVWIPALDELLEARVVKIDRTTGFLDEQSQQRAPGYRWRGPEDRSAQVALQFKSPRIAEDFQRYRSGLPVTVVFEQRSRTTSTGSVAQHLKSLL